jgi:hypothetical protein
VSNLLNDGFRYYALARGHSEFARSFVKLCDPRLTALTNTGDSCLHVCAQRDDVELFRWFHEWNEQHGENFGDEGSHPINKKEQTPLMTAVLSSSNGVAEFIVAHCSRGLDLTKTDRHGSTALHHAVLMGNQSDSLKLLIDAARREGNLRRLVSGNDGDSSSLINYCRTVESIEILMNLENDCG